MDGTAYTPDVSQRYQQVSDLEDKNSHIGQDPVFTRGDPDDEGE